MVTLGRHSDTESGTLLMWVPRVIFGYVALVVVIGGVTLGWILIGSDSSGPPKSGSSAGPLSGGRPSAGSTTTGEGTQSARDDGDLIANAKKIKPLESIQKGDRVIYRGRVCIWHAWNKNIDTSTIKCSGRDRFQTQTARLTPVELQE